MKRLIIALSVVGAILVAAVIFVVWPRSQQVTEIAAGTVDEVEARQIVYLEEYGVFVVSSDLGPIALSDDARHVGDRVLYCAMDNTFSSPAHGERFDRLGRYMGGPAAGDLGRYLTVVTGDRVLVDLTELALPDRSASTDEPVGPGCVSAESSPGFYEDGTP